MIKPNDYPPGGSTRRSLDIINHIRSEVVWRKEHTGVNLFLVWGYPTLIVFLLEFAALFFLHKHWYVWLWAGIPLMGGPLMIYFLRKDYERTGHRTLEANIALQLWLFIGGASAILGFTTGIGGIYPVCYCLIQSLLIGMGGFLTGVVSRFRPMTYCGIIGSILSIACLFFQGDRWAWQFLIAALVTIAVFIIPGHMLRHYVGKMKNEE